ncbi:Ribosyldihydronicotinamide dehydrogenase [quinone] [Galemys pyrenaicus]|uniref:Ribosyldihydronicotinamide dehydrogenase [quinone] n=1 Tax=Galemys pyrenaicus TaxID=202257 RepID=A0A8J6AP79_GALPY|nr:Ribosyldihydronicotinamide dehydrogenase [quinone] [Galemys pyrenaicus]
MADQQIYAPQRAGRLSVESAEDPSTPSAGQPAGVVSSSRLLGTASASKPHCAPLPRASSRPSSAAPGDTMAGKRVLIVYAHQEPRSFNGSLKTAAVEELSRQGCAVTVSDLYAMGFEPRATRQDVVAHPEPDCICLLLGVCRRWAGLGSWLRLVLVLWLPVPFSCHAGVPSSQDNSILSARFAPGLAHIAHAQRRPCFTGSMQLASAHRAGPWGRGCQVHSSAGDLTNPEYFDYGVEVYEACKKRSLASDILAEQRKVQEADLVIFQFPLYWVSMPAILKGWMDRVLCQGFAFDFQGFFDSGFLKAGLAAAASGAARTHPITPQDKLALLSLTTGGTAEMYGKSGVIGDIRSFLWPLQARGLWVPPALKLCGNAEGPAFRRQPLTCAWRAALTLSPCLLQHGALHFCGFKVLAPQINFAPAAASEEERKLMVATWADRLKTIWQEEPIDCSPAWYFQQ